MSKLSKILSWFPFSRKKNTKERTQEIVKALIDNLPALHAAQQELRNRSGAGSVVTTNPGPGQTLGKLYDFYFDAEGGAFPVGDNSMAWSGSDRTGVTESQKKDEREKVKPVDVVAQLEVAPTPVTVEGLEEKIEMFRKKKKFTNQYYTAAQIDGMLKRLENRKKYAEHHEFFSLFKDTTDDKIHELLDKYKLVMKTHDLFVPTFPSEAIDVMERYENETKKICGESPVFYVIAEESDFKEKRKKLDPILLVQSPFGFYWQILGAWDKEMLLLNEL